MANVSDDHRQQNAVQENVEADDSRNDAPADETIGGLQGRRSHVYLTAAVEAERVEIAADVLLWKGSTKWQGTQQRSEDQT